ncbi:P-loop containing nucleoside triphosphate hydrolase protein [Sphaerosporella brunnea]|uniref:P-loop containing nucleoside triphosphate hydrolase protein n=1 Tax=Sphaerosporella brunnea TaxID=1250544 RepID=A0A5J5F188_9PEZI|nr:P-loop containing nucleoside triphosphate hydrolase protein [Sphaerosporella brunnea]
MEIDQEAAASPANTLNGDAPALEQLVVLTPKPESQKPSPQVDENLSALGGGMREMVDLVNRLRAAGIEDLGLPLPRIAVVGNQSAGKSSLIEAISGIKVPRYSGTCTRCPLEITLKEASNADQPWSCHVSLRFKKRYDSSKAGGNPWEDQRTEQVHFLDLTDKSQVEPALVRAQTAILNPSKNYSYFASPDYRRDDVFGARSAERGGATRMGRSNDTELEVKFSPNVVVMEITAPDVPNLSFIDLPGVIQTTESEKEQYLIELVEKLVVEYVVEPDCLILLAMTMKVLDDAVNQSAARLARQLGEDRTIGALTKPDTVELGEHDQWVSILRGHSHRLRHGYFVTKQPNQDALNKGVDSVQARRLEAEFFRNTEPWSTELKDLHHRFGTRNLGNYLAAELGELIKRRLPTIIATIDAQAFEVDASLATLPAPPSENQVVIVDRLITSFEMKMRQKLSGARGENGFRRELRNLIELFDTSLKRTRPQLVVIQTAREEEQELKRLRSGHAPNRHQGMFEDTQREETPTPCNAITAPSPLSPREGSASHQGTPRKRPLTAASTPGRTPRRIKPQRGARVADSRVADNNKYNLPRIRYIMESTSTTGLPNQVDPEAVVNVAKDTLTSWEGIVGAFLNKVHTLVAGVFDECFALYFARYEKSPINKKVHEILSRFFNAATSRLHESIMRLCKLETSQIKTANQVDFEKSAKINSINMSVRQLRNLQDQRDAARAEREEQEMAAVENPATPTQSARGRKRQRPTIPSPTPDDGELVDPYSIEVNVLAQVQAYHDIARKRFVDYAYLAVNGELVEDCQNKLLEELRTELFLDSPLAEENCKQLLVEDPEKERRRKELLSKKAQLQKAKDELSGYLA